ncbi:MAG: peptide chain release factor N(5)-glutamine methyltransferase [Alphaproteobacteria bacterium]|jgi:release factor glutamine methyltransferase|tara:strand:- start:4237 stop:5118 length:882 start_codon:yes stop_codon:yes gene_type:complete
MLNKEPLSIQESINFFSNKLALAGIKNSRLDCQILIEFAMGISRERLIMDSQIPINGNDIKTIDSYINRRMLGEPVSRIIGWREFYGRKFIINPYVLDPRPDSELIINLIKQKIPNENEKINILDLGTGSGALLLTLLSEFPRSTGLGVDISYNAIKTAINNSNELNLQKRAMFLRGNWGESLKKNTFNIIVSNPPYIPRDKIFSLSPDVRIYDPKIALDGGMDGIGFYQPIAKQSRYILCDGGFLITEIGLGQSKLVSAILKKEGFFIKSNDIKTDLSGKKRAIIANCNNLN